jgi:HK97 family phage portal protein
VQILGFTIERTKAVPATLSSVESRGGWWPIVREPFSGAWQDNEEESIETVVAYSAVFACVSLIASDVAKMRLRLVEQDADGIWSEIENAAFSPLLRKPNRFQNRIQFFKWWMTSKLLHGNTYALKVRDNRRVVTSLYILDPTRTRPLVAPDGGVYYELKCDNLSSVPTDITIPASEIIHDVGQALFHPLVGVSPIFACGLASVQGLRIQNNSSRFFANGSKPGGVLTAPGQIAPETAQRVKTYWDENFTGDNMGKVAVLGDGLKYEAMAVNAADAQLIEQLKWTAQNVCTAFRVPAYKIGVEAAPSYNNIEALEKQYYSQCLQEYIEALELVMDEGLGLAPDKIEGKRLGVEFDLDDLLRMDSATLMATVKEGVQSGVFSPNEGRKRFNQKPVVGGNSPMLQQQMFSLEALAQRDRDKPFAKPTESAPASPAAAPAAEDDQDDELMAAAYTVELRKELAA